MLLFLICLGFAILGWWLVRDGDEMGWLSVIFFGLGSIVMGIQMVPGASWLDLDDAGFTFCSLFRTHRCMWTDIQEFGIITIKRKKMVAFNFPPGFDKSRIGRKVSHTLVGYEGALPDTYGLKAKELAELMMRYKQNKL
jgi:hypothetical protein